MRLKPKYQIVMNKKHIHLNNETISLYEFARWAALMEAVELIDNKCKERGIDINTSEGGKFLKPLDIQDYIDSRTDSMVYTIEKSFNEEVKNIDYSVNTLKRSMYSNAYDIGLPI